MIEPSIWSKLHGAATHFPIALVFVSAFCDAASLACRGEDLRRGLRFTGTVTIVLATLGGFGAAFTGLIMTRWKVWGHATLLRHHQFVWPALALMTALTVWRILPRGKASRGRRGHISRCSFSPWR